MPNVSGASCIKLYKKGDILRVMLWLLQFIVHKEILHSRHQNATRKRTSLLKKIKVKTRY